MIPCLVMSLRIWLEGVFNQLASLVVWIEIDTVRVPVGLTALDPQARHSSCPIKAQIPEYVLL